MPHRLACCPPQVRPAAADTLPEEQQRQSTTFFGSPTKPKAALAGAGGGGGGGGAGAGGSSTAAAAAAGNGGGGFSGFGRQRGMRSFFKQQAKCLSCRSIIQSNTGQSGGSSVTQVGTTGGTSRSRRARGTAAAGAGAGDAGGRIADGTAAASDGPPPGVEPGLCNNCKVQEGKWAQVYLTELTNESQAVACLTKGLTQCRWCHSGAQLGEVVCGNGECPVVYERLGAGRRILNVQHRLQRLEW